MIRRKITLLALVVLASGCDRGGEDAQWFGGSDAGAVSSTAADARLDESGRLNFEVTSDVYRRWSVAQQAIGTTPTGRAVLQLGRRALTQRELADAVTRVEGDASARAAVESAGLTPLEYVYATVALEQAMAVARGRLAPRRSGVPSRNVELARERESELVTGGVTGEPEDTIFLPPAVPPSEPLPPVPVPTPRPMPRDTPVPPSPRDTARPAPTDPVPTPTPPTPRPQPIPSPPAPPDTTGGP